MRNPRPAQPAAVEYDVVVIGAGLSGPAYSPEISFQNLNSGLADNYTVESARVLQAAGYSVLVLEAKDCIGGKTRSVSNGADGIVELGAAWINDTNQSVMWAMAQKYGFETVVQRAEGTDCIQHADGSVEHVPYGIPGKATEEEVKQMSAFLDWMKQACMQWEPENISSLKNATELDSVTLQAYCLKHFGPKGAWLADKFIEGFLGINSSDASALFMIDYVRSGTGIDNMGSDQKNGGQYIRNRRGNIQFAEHLAAELRPGTIKLSHPVTHITQSPNRTSLVTVSPISSSALHSSAYLQFRAKRVVLSIPTPLYSHITFSPPLPIAKSAAIATSFLGYTSKAVVIYDAPWWREQGFSGVTNSDCGPIGFTRDTCIEADEQYSMVCFMVGDAGQKWGALEDAEEQKRLVADQIRKMFGGGKKEFVVPDPKKILLQDWAREEWVWGAPCPILGLGVLAKGGAKAIREPWKGVHFVGTETSSVWKGYMEGAVRSGRRGAAEVIAELARV